MLTLYKYNVLQIHTHTNIQNDSLTNESVKQRKVHLLKNNHIVRTGGKR